MSDFSPELKRIVRAAGCYFVRAEGAIMKSGTARNPGGTSPSDSKIKSRHTANAVLKQAGLEKQF
jgi:hypothetical protein